MIRRTRGLAIGLIVAAAALTGCSSDNKASGATTAASATATGASTGATTGDTAGPEAVVTTPVGATTPAPTGAVLTIKGFAFGALTVAAGELFTITNDDTARHTVTADDGSFTVTVEPGTSSDLAIPVAGTYKIHCEIHSSMTGSIVVG
ncbi:unannotated protein [freshwater metagenome]|uniref:Unannotated protein n=1 Tax=freshwater metagenome TaxID=449393 RepID=A0A6J7F9N6_9ZZZZ|nr:hypothetical protein [Actinomycetota bacterium]